MDNGFHSSIMTETIENKQREHLIFRVTLVGSFINFLLLLFKFVAGVLGGSAAMIADAVHSLSDFVTDLIVVLFVRISGKPCDADHDFGHGKYETLATASIGLMLLAVGLGILWNGASEIIAYIKGDNIAEPGLIALVAALVSVISKEFLFQWTARVGRRVDSAVVVANAWHHRSDALSSIGTAVGIGGAILLGPSWRILDPIAAVIVSLFIVRVAFKLFVPSIQELLEKSLPEDEEQFIINVITKRRALLCPTVCARAASETTGPLMSISAWTAPPPCIRPTRLRGLLKGSCGRNSVSRLSSRRMSNHWRFLTCRQQTSSGTP